MSDENIEIQKLWKHWRVHEEKIMQLRMQGNDFRQELRLLNKEISRTHGEFSICLRDVKNTVDNMHDDFIIQKTTQETESKTGRKIGEKWFKQYVPALISLATLIVLIKVSFFP